MDKKQKMIDALSNLSEMELATAYQYAICRVAYGEDITRKWDTATQQKFILDRAYGKGYHDAVKRLTDRSDLEEYCPKDEPTLEEVSLYCKRRHYVIITAELFHFLADGVPGITPVPKLEQMYGKAVSGVIVDAES